MNQSVAGCGRIRAVIYSPFFYPELISTGRYNTFLASALRDLGLSVSVIGSYPLYPDWMPTKTDAAPEGIRVYRGGALVRYPGGAYARRVVLELWYAFHALRYSWRMRKGTDIAIFVFPPVLFGLVARWILPSGVRVVGIVHDLQGVMVRRGVVNGGATAIPKVIKALEGRALRSCDLVICLSKSMQSVVVDDMGVCRERSRVCYPFETKLGSRSRDALEATFVRGCVHIVYSGALGRKQMPRLLGSFFRALCEIRADIVCHIFSRGAEYDELRRDLKLSAGGRVLFHDLVEEQDLGELYRRSHVQVIPQAPGADAAAFPSKLPNILAAGVPVFGICDKHSELAEVIEGFEGVVVEEMDLPVMVRDMLEFLDRTVAESHGDRRRRLGERVRATFSIKGLVEAIVQFEGQQATPLVQHGLQKSIDAAPREAAVGEESPK